MPEVVVPEDRSVIVLVPVAADANANKLWNAIGHSGSSNFGARFSGNGQEPATHLACHSWENEARAILKSAIGAGTLPDIEGGWGDYGLTEQQAQDAADVIEVSVGTGVAPEIGAQQHLAGFLSVRSLQPVQWVD